MHNLGLYIFRRDLRIQNNNALYHALKECKQIIPIFIFTPEQVTNNSFKSKKSVQFMIESLADLKQNIENKNGKLHTMYGDYKEIIKYLLKNENIDSLYVNTDYTPYSKSRDSDIQKICDKNTVKFKTYPDVCLIEPREIQTSDRMYKKFTPFYNECLKYFKNIKQVPSTSFKQDWCLNIDTKFSTSIKKTYIEYTIPTTKSLLQGGRENALHILKNMKDFKDYADTRDNLNKETTHLSAYLKYGCVSAKEVLNTVMKNGFDKNHAFIRQLFWRDFYIHILDCFPHVLKGKPFNSKYSSIKWDNNTKHLNAWKKGETGFPIVDACMRQLNHSGYMHNRGRLIVASFLVKNLFIDWRKGEKYFAQNLIDYDPAANNGNWQWIAGSGVDSQPYFRIFNPWSQSKKHDINANFIKKWCPELNNVPAKDIHEWYKSHSKYTNTVDYTIPIIDYSERRKYVLDKYKKYLD